MKRQFWMTAFVIALASNAALAEVPKGDSTNFQSYEMQLQTLITQVLRDTSRSMRDTAHKQMLTLFDKMLREEGAFDHTFNIEGISIVQPEDKAFRIFTWQVYQDKNTYLYGGFLQMANGTFYKLDDKSAEATQPHFDRLSPKNWYGSLYYNALPFKNNLGKEMYLLFGYDAYSFFNRRKILDVLYFENDKPRFGSQVLEVKDGAGRMRTISRMILEYSATVTVGLNFSPEKNMIVYDHLVNGTPIPGGGPASIPDGSYVGMQLQDGMWKYVEEVFTENPYYGNDNPPMEKNPILDDKKQKDLFGKNNRKQYRWTTGQGQ